MAYSSSRLYDPTYTPITTRRHRRPRSRSVPPLSRSAPPPSEFEYPETTAEFRSNRAWTSSQYIRGLSCGPSYQQKAYDTVRRQFFVPQTNAPRKSLVNAYNLRPPPSYQHTMARMGNTTGLKQQDPYYYASRDYLARTGSYYGTYNRPRHYRASPSNVSQFYPGPADDIYSPSYGGYGSTGGRYGHSSARRRPLSGSYNPVIVESHDDLGRSRYGSSPRKSRSHAKRRPLSQIYTPVIVDSRDDLVVEEAKPLKKPTHQAEVKPPSPPVRAVVGQTEIEEDQGVTDIEQKAEDIKSVISPPVRAVQLGESEVSTDHGAMDLEQHADVGGNTVSAPVRAVQLSQADVAQGGAADFNNLNELCEVAVDLDVDDHPVRVVQLGEADVENNLENDVAELNNPDDIPLAQKATVIEDALAEAAQQNEA